MKIYCNKAAPAHTLFAHNWTILRKASATGPIESTIVHHFGAHSPTFPASAHLNSEKGMFLVLALLPPHPPEMGGGE